MKCQRIQSAKAKLESNHLCPSLSSHAHYPENERLGPSGELQERCDEKTGGLKNRKTLLRRPMSAVSAKQLAVKEKKASIQKGIKQGWFTEFESAPAKQKSSQNNIIQREHHNTHVRGEGNQFDFSIQGASQRISSRPPSGKRYTAEKKGSRENASEVLVRRENTSEVLVRRISENQINVQFDHFHIADEHAHFTDQGIHICQGENRVKNSTDKLSHDYEDRGEFLPGNDDGFVSCFVTEPQQLPTMVSTATESQTHGHCRSANTRVLNKTKHSARQTAWGSSSGVKSRPQSAPCAYTCSRATQDHQSHNSDLNDSTDSDTTNADIKPSVYGLKFRRQVFGDNQCTDEAEMFPYRLQVDDQKFLSLDRTQHDDRVVPAVDSRPTHLGRPLPHTLEPLQEWLCTSADEDKSTRLLGLGPGRCLVFIPDLDLYDYDALQEVPSVQHVDDDLPYINIVVSPEPWVPKKYAHPFKPRNIPEWECSHNRTHLHIYSQDGTLLHRRHEGNRTIDVVRREIMELENLINGLGCDDSNCQMVRYQADITKLQTALRETLSRLPVTERPPSPEPTDHCGLRKFYREHEEVMDQIRQKHAQCLVELAQLEVESGLAEDQWHFSKSDATKIPCL